ncbi:putative gibberellin regulated protein [Helianthus annuus]|nr:putative gibberellin regulated protein [Helianthus annuus]
MSMVFIHWISLYSTLKSYKMGRFQIFFFVFLVASLAIMQLSTAGEEGSVPVEECPSACSVRCSATHHPGNCMDVCIRCCEKCLCVPSGTFGNKDECPCYRDRLTQDGLPKCP